MIALDKTQILGLDLERPIPLSELGALAATLLKRPDQPFSLSAVRAWTRTGLSGATLKTWVALGREVSSARYLIEFLEAAKRGQEKKVKEREEAARKLRQEQSRLYMQAAIKMSQERMSAPN